MGWARLDDRPFVRASRSARCGAARRGICGRRAAAASAKNWPRRKFSWLISRGEWRVAFGDAQDGFANGGGKGNVAKFSRRARGVAASREMRTRATSMPSAEVPDIKPRTRRARSRGDRRHEICFFSSASRLSASSGRRLSRSAARSASRTSRSIGVKSACCCAGAVCGAAAGASSSLSWCSLCSWRRRISRARSMTARGKAGEARDLDAVAFVGAAFLDAAQKDDFVAASPATETWIFFTPGSRSASSVSS